MGVIYDFSLLDCEFGAVSVSGGLLSFGPPRETTTMAGLKHLSSIKYPVWKTWSTVPLGTPVSSRSITA